MIGKDAFIAAHEELIEEYLDENPNASWNEAYNATEDDIYERYQDNIAGMIDDARDRRKDLP